MTTDIETGPVPATVPRRRRRWPLLAAAVAVGAGWGLTAALLVGGGHPAVNVACQRATAAQDGFVDRVVAAGYPDMPPVQAMGVMAEDAALLQAMSDARCPADTKYRELP